MQAVHTRAVVLAEGLKRLGLQVGEEPFFDTVKVTLPTDSSVDGLMSGLESRGINIRKLSAKEVTIALDETTNEKDVQNLWEGFYEYSPKKTTTKLDFTPTSLESSISARSVLKAPHARTSGYLSHPVFNSYHSEHEMLRYIHRLQKKDLGLTTSNIPLGSCTVSIAVGAGWAERGGIQALINIL